ncbi:unnamed protein product [Cuscuta epithymum]|uniref:Sister chromatid cohesion protein PDS5 homolog A n=1 Tax=Cuscuta epithymum TaxID=186058 RepID=A0AAV0FGA8_9ASTE|nr:unnamed protein product [Cuscuta epithymum]
MAESELETVGRIAEIGRRFDSHGVCPGKDTLVKLLKEAADALGHLKQSELMKSALISLSSSLIRLGLLKHKDGDVRLLVGICFCEVIRVLAPNPCFSDTTFRDIFILLLSIFAEFGDTKHAFLEKRVQLLETVANVRFCVLMLDIGSDDLVLKMFKTFFFVLREHHPLSVVVSMSSIMIDVLEEKMAENSDELLPSEGKLPELLLDVILQNLLKDTKGISASRRLAVFIIQKYGGKLEHIIARFLISCILNRNAVGSVVKEYYHKIIYEIFQCAPQVLISVIPNLTNELLTDQVDVRIKALDLIGKLLSLPGNLVAKEYRHLFMEFLNRFSDKSVEVRLNALSWAKTFCTANSVGTESLEVVSALEGRLLDLDEEMRRKAVIVLCDLTRTNYKLISSKTISLVSDRLRDKKVSVREKALQKLLEVYHEYCKKCDAHVMDFSDSFEQIPCKILMLCNGKDSEEFKPQIVERLLSKDLFPASLSTKEITKHWAFIFKLFTPLHLKVLNIILSQKRRLQKEMQVYLALRKKDDGSEDIRMKIKTSVVKMSASFADPAKAEESFYKLNKVKDIGTLHALEMLLIEVAGGNAQAIRDNLMTIIGDGSPHFEFLQLLFNKCLFNIFNSEHVSIILDRLALDRFGLLEDSSVQLLLTIISASPSLLRGLEKQFQHLLLEKVIPFSDLLLQILANVPNIAINLSDIYSSLERLCLEGSRTQSKLACSVIAALDVTNEHSVFPDLCKKLVESLHMWCHIPTVLQSLGCLARYSVAAFEVHAQEVTDFVTKEIFQSMDAGTLEDGTLLEKSSNYSINCKLKIYGLQVLVRSFLPHKHVRITRPIGFLLHIIEHMLQKGTFPHGVVSSGSDSFPSCSESDRAYIKLAAAKSVLRLSWRWDLHIPPQIFCFTVLMAKDQSPWIREHFLIKVQKLLRGHMIPWRYACALSFAVSESADNLHCISMKKLEEFIKDYRNDARTYQTSVMPREVTDSPVYMVVFLIHALAHDTCFPPIKSQDEEICAQFFRPLVLTLLVLVDINISGRDMVAITRDVSYLRNLFYAIKKAEDAVDDQMTHKLHILADIGICYLSSLGNISFSSSHPSGLVLLPSSLYKISPGHKCQEVGNSSMQCKFDKSFIKKILQHITSISMLARNTGKPCPKSQSDSFRTHSSKNLLPELEFCKKGNLPLTRISEHCDSPYSDPKEISETLNHSNGSVKENESMLSISTTVKRSDRGIDGEVTRDKEISSSQAMVECKLSQRGKHSVCLEENDPDNSIAQSTESEKGNTSDNIVSQGIQRKGETLARHKTNFPSVDRCSFSGLVDGVDSYDSANKGSSGSHSRCCDNGKDSLRGCESNMVHTFNSTSDQQNAIVGKDKFHASLKKREQVLDDSCSSKVSRRTRRRKVN